jgi:hypothetical protein
MIGASDMKKFFLTTALLAFALPAQGHSPREEQAAKECIAGGEKFAIMQKHPVNREELEERCRKLAMGMLIARWDCGDTEVELYKHATDVYELRFLGGLRPRSGINFKHHRDRAVLHGKPCRGEKLESSR